MPKTLARITDWPMHEELPVSGDISAIMLFRPMALVKGFLWAPVKDKKRVS